MIPIIILNAINNDPYDAVWYCPNWIRAPCEF